MVDVGDGYIGPGTDIHKVSQCMYSWMDEKMNAYIIQYDDY
jgi:hypothetical protein